MDTPVTAESLTGKPVRIKEDTKDVGSHRPHMWTGKYGQVAGPGPFGGRSVSVSVGSRTKIFDIDELEVVSDTPVTAAPAVATTQLLASTGPREKPRLVYEPPLMAINSPTNPRRRRGLDLDSLSAFAENVRVHGVMSPILVRPLPPERLEETAHLDPRPAYEIVAGERRWRAAGLAELTEMPMLVGEMSDQAVLEMQLVENIEREDLDDMEEAEGFALLRERLGYTVEQIADRIGKGRGPSYVRKTMKLLDLAPDCREAMHEGHLGRSTGLLVARYPADRQAAVLAYIKGQAVKSGKGTEPAPFRLIAPLVHARFNLKLAAAAFDITDPTLVPDAGPCTLCPKRTGADQDLFDDGDMVDGQSCTDDGCFAAKKVVHVQRVRQDAEARGLQVLDGDAAREAKPNPHQPHLAGYVRVSDVAGTVKDKDGTEREMTFDDAMRAKGRKAPKPTVFIDPHTGKAENVIPLALADQLTPDPPEEAAETAKGQQGAATQAEIEVAPEVAAWKNGLVKNEAIKRLFEIVRTRPRSEAELRLAARCLLIEPLPRLERFMGWEEEMADIEGEEAAQVLQEKLAAMTPEQLGELLAMAALEIALTWTGFADVVPHEQLAGYGIDVVAIQEKLVEDEQRREQAPEKVEG